MRRHTLKLSTGKHPFIVRLCKCRMAAGVVQHQVQSEYEGLKEFFHIFDPSPAMLWKTT